ncbi:UNVERIFIED_CONTAM: Fatty acid desaturase 4-like 1, chloroplastic [Sesamum calycinum]|uniref:Fatty acid desaturase 4-like 1, chloroplastic n=1 Tax=Sesamum calycinum TaxID=2727403 RepID=A0AAW2Q3P1_9LAMI
MSETMLHHKINNLSTIDNESWYKATWAHRAWFSAGCATVLISLAKCMLIIAAGEPVGAWTWLQLTLAAVLGYLLADLGSGIYHWAVDNYGSAETPVFGSQIESFRAHHQHPSAITKCDTAGILYTLAGVVTVAVLPINVVSSDPIFLWFVGVFAGCGMFSLKFHAWAHTPRRKLPRVVAALQDAGIILRLSHHTAHHRPPYNSNYCTVSGICNRVLDEGKVLVAMEVALFRVIGVRPRSWAEPNSEWTPRTRD